MNVDITTIPLGFGQCYLLRANGVVAVDAGAPNKGKRFCHALKSAACRPEDLKLLILTHGHWDHIGSAAEIKASSTAKIAMHRSEVSWLENSLTLLVCHADAGVRHLDPIGSRLVREDLDPLHGHPPIAHLDDVPASASRRDRELDDS